MFPQFRQIPMARACSGVVRWRSQAVVDRAGPWRISALIAFSVSVMLSFVFPLRVPAVVFLFSISKLMLLELIPNLSRYVVPVVLIASCHGLP